MKKFLVVCLLAVFSLTLFSSCALMDVVYTMSDVIAEITDDAGERVSVHGETSSIDAEGVSYMDLSIEELQERFNYGIPEGRAKADLQMYDTVEGFPAYFCELEDGIMFFVLTSPDKTKIYTAQLFFDKNGTATISDYGSCFRMLVDALTPDATREELDKVGTVFDEEMLTDRANTVIIRDVIYGMTITDEGEYQLIAIAND